MTLDSVVEPARCSRVERDALTDELYEVHAQIFDGVGPDAFRRYVIEPEGARTRLQVFRDTHGDAVGYIAIHRFVRRVGTRDVLILRSEVGLLRPFRGRAPQARFVLLETARAWLAHAGGPTYVFACPVHPGSYYGVTRRACRSWPRPGETTPPQIAGLISQLCRSFGLPSVSGADPLVRAVGWVTRESREDRDYWARHPAAEVAFYRRTNPEYGRGHGLCMLVPVTPRLVLQGMLGTLGERLRRWARLATRRASARISTGSPAR
ncbi:MAG: hypothetical protein ACE37F_34545 [Nannocystaceae bacterium]|nr:hypothetical protein [bacterium]